MAQLLVVRHALSTWNAAGRWQGLADPPLSEIGRDQARHARERLVALAGAGPWDAVVSSDLHRAAETADHLRVGLDGPPPLRRDPALREYDVGAWSGLTRAEIEARWPGEVDAWNAGLQAGPPGGETTEEFEARVRRAFGALAGTVPEGGRVLVVAHGHLIRSLLAWAGAGSLRVAHLAGAWVARTAGGLVAGARVDLLDGHQPPDDSE